MKEVISYTIIAFIVFVSFIELNRINVNSSIQTKVEEHIEQGRSESRIKSNPGLQQIPLRVSSVLFSSFPLIFIGVLYSFSSKIFKSSFFKLFFPFLIVFLVSLKAGYLAYERMEVSNHISWLFYILALDHVRRRNYLLGAIFSVLWLNFWIFINDWSLPSFSKIYLEDNVIFTNGFDYVPTILALIMFFAWVVVKKLLIKDEVSENSQ